MKVYYSSLQCPNCGATDPVIVNGDIFQCEYCGEKFNFDIDNIVLSAENRIVIEELKSIFQEKIQKIYEDKSADKFNLDKYTHKASAHKLENLSIAVLIFGVLMLSLIFEYIFCIVISTLCFVVYGILKYFRNKIYKKYKPLVEYYALKIVEYDEQISIYTKLISKLTK